MRTALVVLVACGGAGQPAPTPPPNTTNNMFSKADSYEHFMGRWSRLVAPELVKFAGVRDGETVLDVGSGTGVLSFAIRDATTTTTVTGVDPSADYVKFASARGDARVHFAVGDGQKLELPAGAFDRTLSLLVLNFIPDRARAVSEMMRVTKPGGTITAAVWDYGEGMEMLRVFFDEAVVFDPAVEALDEKHMPLSKQGELAALWKAQGLVDIEEVPIVVPLRFASFDDFWSPFLLGQGPAGSYVAKLPKDRQAALEQRLRARLLGGGPDHAIELHGRVWAVKGVVPQR